MEQHSSHFRKTGVCRRHQQLNQEFVEDSGASMHMISTKDLNSAELETVTTSRSPMTVLPANCEVQTSEEATVYIKELNFSWRRNSSRIRQQFCRWESFAMNMDTHMSGSMVKNHISFKMVLKYSAIRKISYWSWFLVYQPTSSSSISST